MSLKQFAEVNFPEDTLTTSIGLICAVHGCSFSGKTPEQLELK